MSTKFAELETTRGKITVELFDRDCPETVDNLERLANAGFYDGLTFHRVVPNVCVQTGDPLSRDLPAGDGRLGEGGPGYTIRCETVGNRRRHLVGAVSMAHQGRDTGGSQFFFVLDDALGREWNGMHTVFGQTTEGLDIVRAIELGDRVLSLRIRH
jgi:peptidyl-prolyl cis-trans isomerase B (cyclophilin B)